MVANPDVVPASNPVSVNAPAQGSDPLLASNADDGEAAPEYDNIADKLADADYNVGPGVGPADEYQPARGVA